MNTAKLCLFLGALVVSAASHANDAVADAAMLGGGLEGPAPSQAADVQTYRLDAARHIYRNFPALVHQGQLPTPLHAVAIIETTINPDGTVDKVEVIREPDAKAATPWIVGMIQAAQPYPAASRLGKVTYRDIWLIAQGRFQLEALTEGQHHTSGTQLPVQRHAAR